MAKKRNNNYANYSLVVYDKSDLEYIINMNTVDKYAYIYHNKDESEPHYHLYIHFTSRRRLKWLEYEKLTHTFEQNVMCERVIDVNQLFLYFLHRNNPEKYQYSIKDIISNYNFMDANENDKDDNADILECILAIIEHKLTWAEFLKRYPNLIFSMSNIKRTYDVLFNERYTGRKDRYF